ncbi:MAG: phage regulatory CII family protein [Gallionellaceae bacterium]
MTLKLDDSTVLGALYGAAKKYPGGIRQLAADMDMPESTLYAKLRNEKGYPLGIDEAVEILNFMRGQDVPGWQKAVQVFCHQLDHLAVPIPRAMRLGDVAGLQQVSEMMQEVADIAHALSDGTDSGKDGGRQITTAEWKKIAETREFYKALHMAAKKKGLVN